MITSNIRIKQCNNYDTSFHGIFVPCKGLYGTVTMPNGKGKIPFCVPEFPRRMKDLLVIRVYSYDYDRWYTAQYKGLLKPLYLEVTRYIVLHDLLGVRTVQHENYNASFQTSAPFGRSHKNTGFKEANKARWKRGDGAGTMSYSGTTLYDTIRNDAGELEYNFNGKKPPITYWGI